MVLQDFEKRKWSYGSKTGWYSWPWYLCVYHRWYCLIINHYELSLKTSFFILRFVAMKWPTANFPCSHIYFKLKYCFKSHFNHSFIYILFNWDNHSFKPAWETEFDRYYLLKVKVFRFITSSKKKHSGKHESSNEQLIILSLKRHELPSKKINSRYADHSLALFSTITSLTTLFSFLRRHPVCLSNFLSIQSEKAAFNSYLEQIAKKNGNIAIPSNVFIN